MAEKKKQLYLVITLSPFGLKLVTFRLTDKKPDPFRFTRGEGNCLVFKLVDWDYSTNFNTAMNDGTILKEFGDFSIEADLSLIPEKKKKHEKELAKFKKENGYE